MIQRYVSLMQSSIAERDADRAPAVAPILIAGLSATLVYILLALVLIPAGEPAHYHFVNEDGATTALSAILLAASSAFSLATMMILRRGGEPFPWVWCLLALGFAFLSFDELLQFHERLGKLMKREADSGVFRSWNDVIVIGYGVVALPIMAVTLPGLIRLPKVLELFVIGFGFYMIHTLVDSLNEPPTITSVVIEESAKLFCGTFLAVGAFTAFRGAVWRHVSSDKSTS